MTKAKMTMARGAGGAGAHIAAAALDADDRPEDQDEQTIFEAIDSSTAGDRWKIQVFRDAGKAGETQNWMFDIAPAELPDIQTRLRDECHGGKFVVMVRRNGGFYTRLHYAIEVKAPPPPAPASADGALAVAIKEQSTLLARVMERLTAPVTTPAAAPAMDIVQTFTLFTQMQQALKGMHPEPPPAGTAMDVFRAGVDFAKEAHTLAGAGGASDDGISGVLTSFLNSPVAQKLFERWTATADSTPAIAAPAPAMTPQPRTIAPPLVAQQYIASIVQQLVGFAAQGVEVAQAADWMAENVPLGMLRQFASDPKMIDQVALVIPGVAQHRGYFDSLRVEISQGMMAEGGGNEPPVGEGDDAGNGAASGNAYQAAGGNSGGAGDYESHAPVGA